MNSAKLLVIALEGMNGSGKTSTLSMISDMLTDAGIESEIIKFPGGCDVGSQIRKILLDKSNHMSVLAEFFLFAADNAQTWIECVESRFGYRSKPLVILCDRSLLSSLAFQGVRGLSEDTIVRGALAPCENVFLSKIYVLNLPWCVAAERLRQRGDALDRIESFPVEIQQATAQKYREVSVRGTFAGSPVMGLNGEDSIKTNAQKITADILTLLKS